jgi:AcrR family transcriptional regulator
MSVLSDPADERALEKGRARARRTYKPADDRRQQILDSATATFAQKGYHAASIADVCQAAGIGRGTLYQYFDDKIDLLRALADRIVERITTALAACTPLRIPEGYVPTEAEAVQFLERRLVRVLQVVFGDAPAARLILRRGADGMVDGILRRLDQAVMGQMQAELEEAIRAKVVRPLDVPFVIRFVLGGIEKNVLDYLDSDQPIDIEKIAHEAALLEIAGTYLRSPDPR